MPRGFIDTPRPVDHRAEARKFLDKTRSRGHYLSVPRAWLQHLNHTQANTVVHLLGAASLNADRDGWTLYTVSYVTSGLGLSAERQTKILNALADLGVLEITHKSSPRGGAARYVRVDIERLETVVSGG